MSSNDPMTRVGRCFRDRFSTEPLVVATAPGRVNLLGEHIDHRDGVVLPFAIDRRAAIAVSPATEGRTTIISDDLGLTFECPGPPPGRPDPDAGFANHLLGVVDGLRSTGRLDFEPRPLSVAIASDLPAGGGLSSSAAIEVATGLAIAAIHDLPTPDVRTLAKVARRAEHDWVGTPCGIMDMLASAGGRAGRILAIDCGSLTLDELPAPSPDDFAFMLLDSGVRHRLADGGYASRLASLERVESVVGTSLKSASLDSLRTDSIDDVDRSRARHVITEMARVEAAVDALTRTDLARLGALMFQGHDSLRDDFGVSTPELDLLVEACRSRRGRGVLGARMTGGGFGGWVVALVERRSMKPVLHEVLDEFESRFDRRPELLEVRPSDGARIEATPGHPLSYPRRSEGA